MWIKKWLKNHLYLTQLEHMPPHQDNRTPHCMQFYRTHWGTYIALDCRRHPVQFQDEYENSYELFPNHEKKVKWRRIFTRSSKMIKKKVIHDIYRYIDYFKFLKLAMTRSCHSSCAYYTNYLLIWFLLIIYNMKEFNVWYKLEWNQWQYSCDEKKRHFLFSMY